MWWEMKYGLVNETCQILLVGVERCERVDTMVFGVVGCYLLMKMKDRIRLPVIRLCFLKNSYACVITAGLDG